MKPVRTPDADVTFTSPGGGFAGDLPAQRILLYDGDRGETEQDARLGHQTIWQPDEDEARRLEAGACVILRVWGKHHPPVTVAVTDAVVPERELIDRGHVDRALGHLYGQLRAGSEDGLPVLPAPPLFATLWAEAVEATRDPSTTDASPPPGTNGRPT